MTGVSHPTDAPVEVRGRAGEPDDLPALVLRDGLPEVIADVPALNQYLDRLRVASGPIAVDTERASGYRYGQSAYLIQLRRDGAGTALIDPQALPQLPGLAAVLTGPEWILHAASQDLPCLAELGLQPSAVFDTELAGRLLDLPRVGLAPMVAAVLGRSLAKGHGAADWSKRPLPPQWLEYAALDVEVLIELRAVLVRRLAEEGKAQWARQEFAAIRDAPPPTPRPDPWRRTSGIHRIRTRRGLAIVQQLWLARERAAAAQDVAPGRLLPDAALVAAGAQEVRDAAGLRALKEFHGRGAARHREAWAAALQAAWDVPPSLLPPTARHGDGPPPRRAWGQRNPEAAHRLERARPALKARAAALHVPVENLLAPDIVRRLMWQPPTSQDDVAARLAQAGARPWQIDNTQELLCAALWPDVPRPERVT